MDLRDVRYTHRNHIFLGGDSKEGGSCSVSVLQGFHIHTELERKPIPLPTHQERPTELLFSFTLLMINKTEKFSPPLTHKE